MIFNAFDFDHQFGLTSLKTDLFTQLVKVQRLNSELEMILKMPKRKKDRWVEKNELFLTRMLEQLSSDSSLILESIDGDDQELSLSIEYVESLRDAMNTLSSILYHQQTSVS